MMSDRIIAVQLGDNQPVSQLSTRKSRSFNDSFALGFCLNYSVLDKQA